MVLKSATVLSCLIPARLGFGSNHKADPPPRTRNKEKHASDKLVAHDRLGDPEFDPFRGDPLQVYSSSRTHPDLSRARANTAPSDSPLPTLVIPNGGIVDSSRQVHRSLVPALHPKRSSFTTFFAFSSKRRSTHGAPIVHLPQHQQDLLVPSQSVSGRWVSGGGQTQVHLVNPASIPSPLRTDEEEYYCSYYASLTPTFPSHSASLNSDVANRSPSKQSSLRQQDLIGNSDLDSQPSSPVDSHPSHTHIRHPYAYPAPVPLYSKSHPKSIDTVPPLRHATSQPFQHNLQASYSGASAGLAYSRISSSQHGHEAPTSYSHLSQPELKTSRSTPNLASGSATVRARSLIRKRPPTRSRGRECWLSAETWWDALLSPSPRFKVKQAPRNPAADRIVNVSIGKLVEGEQNRDFGVAFPSTSTLRPRALSATPATSNVNHTHPALTRSRSAMDLLGPPSTSVTSHAGFQPALETLADEPTPPPDQVPGSDSGLPLPEPPLTLEQVLDEGEALEQQRAQWKRQASKSLGNKHIRSFSRARSKSLGEKHVRLGQPTLESSKAQLHLEFLAARTLLGSQSTMPIVHVTKPSNSSFHSKAYSHSHSQSAYSHTHSSHSRAYSHSHSHSLTTSNSSKSSRNLPPRSNSQSGSCTKAAFWRAGSLCGIGQDESSCTDHEEKVPSSSRVDVQGMVYMSDSSNAEGITGMAKVSSSPGGEVGIAISPSPPPNSLFNINMTESRRPKGDRESHWSSMHTHKSSEYAGPHPSAIDSNLPRLGGASDVSLRHRLPPRAAIHPPILPIAHPYRAATAQPEKLDDKGSKDAALKVTEGQGAMELSTGRPSYPHISLSHADFERYGVGEALVYASLPQPEKVPETKQADIQGELSRAAELSSSQEQSPSCEAVALQPEERDTSSLAMNSIPSLTNSTIQMVMSAFDNPDDLDEFQDLFYKPHSASGVQRREPSSTTNQVPTDVHSSTTSSPLAHLVRKLSEEVNSLRDPSRTPSDSIPLHRSGIQDQPSNESAPKFVFMDLARSSSPPPMESCSQLDMPIQEGSGPTAQLVTVIPEDVNSCYTSSVLESTWEDQENDTFGHPIKHGQLDAITPPSPIQSPVRVSTHLSIQEGEAEEGEDAFLSPVMKRYGSISADAVRASYLTTSDLSQMSELSDFPLPPSARPISILQAYREATPPSSTSESHDDESEVERGNRQMNGEEDREPFDDVKETLRALRMMRG